MPFLEVGDGLAVGGVCFGDAGGVGVFDLPGFAAVDGEEGGAVVGVGGVKAGAGLHFLPEGGDLFLEGFGAGDGLDLLRGEAELGELGAVLEDAVGDDLVERLAGEAFAEGSALVGVAELGAGLVGGFGEFFELALAGAVEAVVEAGFFDAFGEGADGAVEGVEDFVKAVDFGIVGVQLGGDVAGDFVDVFGRGAAGGLDGGAALLQVGLHALQEGGAGLSGEALVDLLRGGDGAVGHGVVRLLDEVVGLGAVDGAGLLLEAVGIGKGDAGGVRDEVGVAELWQHADGVGGDLALDVGDGGDAVGLALDLLDLGLLETGFAHAGGFAADAIGISPAGVVLDGIGDAGLSLHGHAGEGLGLEADAALGVPVVQLDVEGGLGFAGEAEVGGLALEVFLAGGPVIDPCFGIRSLGEVEGKAVRLFVEISHEGGHLAGLRGAADLFGDLEAHVADAGDGLAEAGGGICLGDGGLGAAERGHGAGIDELHAGDGIHGQPR